MYFFMALINLMTHYSLTDGSQICQEHFLSIKQCAGFPAFYPRECCLTPLGLHYQEFL